MEASKMTPQYLKELRHRLNLDPETEAPAILAELQFTALEEEVEREYAADAEATLLFGKRQSFVSNTRADFVGRFNEQSAFEVLAHAAQNGIPTHLFVSYSPLFDLLAGDKFQPVKHLGPTAMLRGFLGGVPVVLNGAPDNGNIEGVVRIVDREGQVSWMAISVAR